LKKKVQKSLQQINLWSAIEDLMELFIKMFPPSRRTFCVGRTFICYIALSVALDGPFRSSPFFARNIININKKNRQGNMPSGTTMTIATAGTRYTTPHISCGGAPRGTTRRGGLDPKAR
jgi:hypothetical protein